MNMAGILAAKGGDVVSVGRDVSLEAAAGILAARKVGAVVVLGPDGLEGILSERDIVREVAARGAAALADPVARAMTADVLTAAPSDPVDSALARMTDRRIRHLPVIDGGMLVGVVSIGDLVKSRIDEALAEADAMRAYIASG